MSGSSETIRWVRRGRDQNPQGAYIVLSVALFAGILGYFMLSLTGLIVGPAVVLLSTADFLFGKKFELNEKEAKAWIGPSISAMSWVDVARVVRDRHMLLLLPQGVEGWRQSFRGIALEPTEDNREVVERTVRERIPASAAYEA